jgi:ATP synthase protein I
MLVHARMLYSRLHASLAPRFAVRPSEKLPDTRKLVAVADKEDQDQTRKSGFAYAAGITLFAAVASFCAFGWFLDKWLGTDPWLLIVGIVLGSAAGLYEFVRISSKTY